MKITLKNFITLNLEKKHNGKFVTVDSFTLSYKKKGKNIYIFKKRPLMVVSKVKPLALCIMICCLLNMPGYEFFLPAKLAYDFQESSNEVLKHNSTDLHGETVPEELTYRVFQDEL